MRAPYQGNIYFPALNASAEVYGCDEAAYAQQMTSSTLLSFFKFCFTLFVLLVAKHALNHYAGVIAVAEVYRKTAKPPGQTAATGFDNSA